MSPRTTKRRRRTKAQLAAAGTGTPATLLSQVSELVNENQALVRENKELHTIIARVTQAVHVVSSAPRRIAAAYRLDEPPHPRPMVILASAAGSLTRHRSSVVARHLPRLARCWLSGARPKKLASDRDDRRQTDRSN